MEQLQWYDGLVYSASFLVLLTVLDLTRGTRPWWGENIVLTTATLCGWYAHELASWLRSLP